MFSSKILLTAFALLSGTMAKQHVILRVGSGSKSHWWNAKLSDINLESSIESEDTMRLDRDLVVYPSSFETNYLISGDRKIEFIETFQRGCGIGQYLVMGYLFTTKEDVFDITLTTRPVEGSTSRKETWKCPKPFYETTGFKAYGEPTDIFLSDGPDGETWVKSYNMGFQGEVDFSGRDGGPQTPQIIRVIQGNVKREWERKPFSLILCNDADNDDETPQNAFTITSRKFRNAGTSDDPDWVKVKTYPPALVVIDVELDSPHDDSDDPDEFRRRLVQSETRGYA